MATEGEFEGFRVEEVLARSATTTVYRAFQHSLQRAVLIKELRPELFQEKDILGRFQREAQVCALIKHENVVDIHDYTVKPGRIFLVTEYVSGCALSDMLQKNPSPPQEVILAVIVQTLRGLAHAHSKGVIHRDLKPSNILIAHDGWVKITDFGLAVLEGAAMITQPGAVVGTPAYISPEAISGGAITSQSDLFSLGATFYELATAQRIFHAEHFSDSLKKVLSYHPPPISQFRNDLSHDLDRVILRMLEKQPARRWLSAAEILNVLESLHLMDILGDPRKVIFRFLQQPEKAESPLAAEIAQRAQPAGRVKRRPMRKGLSIGITSAALFTSLCLAIGIFWWKKGASPLKWPTPEIRRSAEQPGTGVNSRSDSIAAVVPTATKPDAAELRSQGQRLPSKVDKKAEKAVQEINQGETEAVPLHQTGSQSKPALVPDLPRPKISSAPRERVLLASSAPARLKIQCDPWAEVYLDNILIDRTPFEPIELAQGDHQLAFRHPAFPPVFREVKAKPGEEILLKVNLWEMVGRIVVLVDTWANIYIDDSLMAVTPLKEPLIVSLGVHKVMLKNPAFPPWEKTVSFQRGDPPCTLRVNLQPVHGSQLQDETEPQERTGTERFSGGRLPADGDSLHP